MRFSARLLTLLAACATPALAFAAPISWSIGISIGNGGCSAGGICPVASTILYLINSVLVPTLFAISFLVFLYGVSRKYIWSNGDQAAVEQGHQIILWGLIGFAVMVSLWGIVNVVANTFGLWGYGAPQLPSSYPAY
ncbi:MAG: hypothetical protein ACYC6X_00280 [Minisyncoccota bacterium]